MAYISMKQIKYGSSEYDKELSLRDEVLRKPLGKSIYEEDLKCEKDDIHLGAFTDDELIGVLILTPLNKTDVKMRQVAVREEYRNQGIGRGLVKYAEHMAKGKLFNRIVINARETAVSFYEKLDYVKYGDRFLELSIPHYKMYKDLF